MKLVPVAMVWVLTEEAIHHFTSLGGWVGGWVGWVDGQLLWVGFGGGGGLVPHGPG